MCSWGKWGFRSCNSFLQGPWVWVRVFCLGGQGKRGIDGRVDTEWKRSKTVWESEEGLVCPPPAPQTTESTWAQAHVVKKTFVKGLLWIITPAQKVPLERTMGSICPDIMEKLLSPQLAYAKVKGRPDSVVCRVGSCVVCEHGIASVFPNQTTDEYT